MFYLFKFYNGNKKNVEIEAAIAHGFALGVKCGLDSAILGVQKSNPAELAIESASIDYGNLPEHLRAAEIINHACVEAIQAYPIHRRGKN